jgi:hypothetical protein
MSREIKLKDLVDLYEALKDKQYDVDNMVLLVGQSGPSGKTEDTVWGIQVLDYHQILLEV